jgi:SWI/SNF-related matrix-associated actin-dependent regulator of chromatin subfamily A member 5
VTEHTIEEKIVERAQQKLKLDAMVVQSGRLKEKDKLSSGELLDAVRFGADKVFKSKDSSITDDDIDMILDSGKKKTQKMNEKLKSADKGDLLDFKLDGGISAQTFEGVDYSLAKAAQEEMFIMDIGKRERKTVAYNENQLYHEQLAALQGGVKKERKKKQARLPKVLRLPRMEDWQMYDRSALMKIQEEEELAFRSLPEEQQKAATAKPTDNISADGEPIVPTSDLQPLPPLLSEEKQARKTELLAEGFSSWKRQHYTAFVKGSAKFGRQNLEMIAVEVGKPLTEVQQYAAAFWDEEIGMKRISEHEYDRVVKMIDRGEKRLAEIGRLERATRILVSIFDNPWVELTFTHVNCKDKMFTPEEDRYLLCWAHKVCEQVVTMCPDICPLANTTVLFVCCVYSVWIRPMGCSEDGDPSKPQFSIRLFPEKCAYRDHWAAMRGANESSRKRGRASCQGERRRWWEREPSGRY